MASIQGVYIALFGRPADPLGLAFFNSATNNGANLTAIGDLASTAEYQNRFTGQSTTQIITTIYRSLFNRDPDLAGLTFFATALANGTLSINNIAIAIFDGAQGSDVTIRDLKVSAANAFTAQIDTVAEINGYAGTAAAQSGVAFITGVTTTAPTAEQVSAAVLAATTTTTPSATFTLTTASDNFPGTSGNDLFNGSVSATAADNTLTVTDIINGGAGTDTLSVTASVLAADIAVPVANVQSVEVVNIRALDADGTVGTDAATLAAGAGVTSVNADRSSSNVKVTGLATGASVGMIGDGVVNNGILSYAYATATADQVINISNGTKNGGVANITATASTGVTKATINSTGAANSVDTILLDSAAGNTVTSLTVNAATNLTATLTANDFAATAALTVSGAATSVDLGAAFDGKTIDASGLTAGGVTIATNANLTSLKGGQGNDTVTTSALAAAAVAGAVDAGAGTGDILNVAAGADVDTAAEAALFTNFEVLRNSGTTDLDVSLLAGITSVQLNNAAAGATKLTAAQAADVRVLTSNGTNTVSLATATGTSDVLGLTLQNLTAAAVATPIDVTALTATGFETINIVSSSGVKAGGTGTGNDLAFAAAGDLTKINVSGEYDLTIAAANITKAVTITSTQTGTGALYVSGNFANGSSVTGSVGADAFVLGTGFGTYTGGAGNDTFSGTAAQLNTGADYNVIAGGEGTDTLNITGGVALNIVDNNLSKLTGVEKIVVATTAANNQSIQTGGFFDAAFKATGVELTTTSTTGSITIDMTSFTGAATLSTTSTTGAQSVSTGTSGGNDKVTSVATTGNVTVSTGAGDDVVSVTTAGTAGGEGAITVTTGAGNDTITVVNAVAGDAATITGGAGADKITLGLDAAVVVVGNTDSGITLATADSITGFKTTTDTLKLGFNGGATNATEAAAVVANFETAQTNANAALAALKVANPGSTELANFQWDATNGYLFNDTNADGTADQVIVLVGITGATFAVADIVA